MGVRNKKKKKKALRISGKISTFLLGGAMLPVKKKLVSKKKRDVWSLNSSKGSS